MGYGSKYLLKVDKKDETTPGPIYNKEDVNSLAFLNRVRNRRETTFGNNFEKYDKV